MMASPEPAEIRVWGQGEDTATAFAGEFALPSKLSSLPNLASNIKPSDAPMEAVQ